VRCIHTPYSLMRQEENSFQFGLETGVAYTIGEFRGKDGWLRAPVEVGISSCFGYSTDFYLCSAGPCDT